MTDPRYVGVDGAPGGWLAVRYDGDSFHDVQAYADVEALWDANRDAETILVDVPIGLRENGAEKRRCDDEARSKLGHPRSSSVFAPPVRAAVHADSYADAKETQEERTDGSLGTQSWAICGKIAEVDALLRDEATDATGVLREAHPEVCFWALNDEESMTFSKTSQPAAAFWERVQVLERVDEKVLDHLCTAGETLTEGAGSLPDDDLLAASNDDLLDAFALALTASDRTAAVQTLPERSEPDPAGLPMEMVYAHPS
jgi:predicted RNase H-like nuclease